MRHLFTMMICAVISLPAGGFCAEGSYTDPEERDFPADYSEVETDPEVGQRVQKHVQDAQQGAQQNFDVQFVHDNELFTRFIGDRIEYQSREGDAALLWDVQAWAGFDYNKLWFKSEGSWLVDEEKVEEAETELLYSRNISSFWDLQLGIRHDFKPDPDRTFAAFGIQGLAPYWFESEATAYLSEDGDLSAVVEVEYDMLLSQRLVLQPRFETLVALQEVEEYGVGQGINFIEMGLRLRYHFTREFAPYIGVSWNRKLFEAEDLAEAEGEDTDTLSLVAGLRIWL
ncbi:copper resistance protein B [Desulfopila inferna]|uniref:copper resistance protein B n=1 Tax=Desulfopila inferna TaxID=468528 RepID=UPI001965A5C0|nr:copper resistance protein B [Desulfopila inferna]MBM9606524.1 copper resistance protein B [Desulfopila inferna]